MKNIIIFGSSRSGKTQLAKLLADKLNYSIIMVDNLVSAFERALPQLKINNRGDNEMTTQNLEPFLMSYLRILNGKDNKARGINFVIDGVYFEFDRIIELKERFVVIILLNVLKSADEFYNQITKHDQIQDWTYHLSPKELKSCCENLYEENKTLLQKCKNVGIEYYDTSQNREQVFCKILEKIKQELND